MRPILSTAQVRQADAHTIAHTPIASIDLMERAAEACTRRILALEPHTNEPYHVVCGLGNNGGDGLAIVRMLLVEGRMVRALVLDDDPGKRSTDNAIELERARTAGVDLHMLRTPADLQAVTGGTIVDALLGTGTDRPLGGFPATVVQWMNDATARRIAIDLPSGMNGDRLLGPGELAVRADHTLVLHCLRPGLFHRENASYLGEWEVVPIGLDDAFIATLPTDRYRIETLDAGACLPALHRFMHKGDRGHAFLLAGSRNYDGAAVMAAEAVSRSGAGLCTLCSVAPVIAAINARTPEVMTMIDPDPAHLSTPADLSPATAIGVGPGIGTATATANLLKLLIQEARAPMVIDADALNILSQNKTWLAFLPKGTILTPHPKEFDRLTEGSANSMDRLEKARDMAMRFAVVVVLKGAFTAICTPAGQIFFNPTGGPGMAKGGSGDVLTGLLTGLLAQGLSPERTAILGTYVHGLAGDLAARSIGVDAMKAGDVIDQLGEAFKSLRVPGQNRPSMGPTP